MKNFTNLIKSAAVLLISASSITATTAQTHFKNEGSYELSGIPGNLQCNGKTQLFLFNYNLYDGKENAYKLLDQNFQIEKEFSFKPTPVIRRTVYQERKVNGYTEDIFVYDPEDYYGYSNYWETGKSLEEFCEYWNTHLNQGYGQSGVSNIKPEDFITIKGIYFLPNEVVKIPTIDYPDFETRGITYNPKNGLIIGGVYSRSATLSDQWETIKEEENASQYAYFTPPSYDNYDNNTNGEIRISQNFFNNDEKYEFIVPTYAINTEGDISYTDFLDSNYGDEEFAYKRYIRYDSYPQGFNVVNEDGNILHTFDLPKNEGITYLQMFTFNSKNYFVVYQDVWETEDATYTDIYEIDNQTSDIKKVQQLSNFSIQPRTPRRNEPVTVELLENEANQNHEVIVTSTDGRVAQRTTLHAGNKAVRLNTSRLNAGLYNVTVLKNGQKVESAKIIVR